MIWVLSLSPRSEKSLNENSNCSFEIVNKLSKNIKLTAKKILAKINTVLVLILKKLEDTLNLVNSLITNSFIFLRTSLEIKNIKRVLFILIMSIAMAFVLVGVNLIFGKLIL